MTKAAVALDGVNQFLHIGVEVAHFTGSKIETGVISHIKTVEYASDASGQTILEEWKEVQLKDTKKWVKASRVVRVERGNPDPIHYW